MSKGKGKSERSELRDKNSYGEETTSIPAPLLPLARSHIDRLIKVDMIDIVHGFITDNREMEWGERDWVTCEYVKLQSN